MPSLPPIPNGPSDEPSRPASATASGDQGGGGEGKTRVGTGDGGEGNGVNWMAGNSAERDPNRKVLYSHLKDIAIDALEISGVKDQQAIAGSLRLVLGSYDMQIETADVLASMVVAAYSCACETHDERAIFLAYSCFSDAQLDRIVKLARKN